MTDNKYQKPMQFDQEMLRRQKGFSQLSQLAIGASTGISPFNSRFHDVRFRGKMIEDLTREEAIEALHQAIAKIRAMEGPR